MGDHLSRIWVFKGTRPDILMYDNHEKLTVFSAADPVKGRVHYHISDSLSSHEMVGRASMPDLIDRYPTIFNGSKY
jgi:hypothetical protein